MARNKDKETIEFEIKFYEGLISKKADFTEALAALGDLYTHIGEYQKGLDIDERLVLLRPEDPVVLYNLACSYSLLNDRNKAFRSIKKAIKCGYDNIQHIERDEDLFNLRADSRFQKYFSRLKQRIKEDSYHRD